MSATAGQEVTRLLYTGDSSPSGEREEREHDGDRLRQARQDGERLADFDAAVAEIAADVLPACRAADTWLERTRAGLSALLCALDRRPETAKTLVVDSIAWGPEVLERRGELLEALAEALAPAPAELARAGGRLGEAEPLPETTAENLIGASLSWIHARLQGEGGPLTDLEPSLMSMIVHPYLGSEAAQRELERSHTEVGAELAGRERRDPPAAPSAVSARGSSTSQPPISGLRETPS
jgi:hypothetical protein